MKYPRIAQMIFGQPLMVSPDLMAQAIRFANASLKAGVTSNLEIEFARAIAEGEARQREAVAFHDGETERSPAERERLKVYNGIAYINIHGPIVSRIGHVDACTDMTSIEKASREFKAALADEGVQHIVFDLDSGGGTPIGTFEFAEEIYNARATKPTTALVHYRAYSAAYLIASACSQVHISQTSGTGSVGVIAEHVDWSKYLDELGAKTTTVFKGDHKNDLSPNEPITEQSLKVLNDECQRLYTMFVQAVAKYRGMDVQAVIDTQAALYSGQQGVDVGLADSVGSLQGFVDDIAKNLSAQSTQTLSNESTVAQLAPGRIARAASAMQKQLQNSL